MSIDATNLALVRLEYGDVSETVFTDTEIGTLWDLMSGASSDDQRRRATIGQMFLITLNNAAKLHDYTQNQSSDKLSQVYAHLKDRYLDYKSALDAALGRNRVIARSTLKTRPHQERRLPADDHRGDQLDKALLPDDGGI